MVKLLFGLLGIIATFLVLDSRSPSPLHLPVAVEGQVSLGGEPLRELVPGTGSERLADRAPETLRLSNIQAFRSEGRQAVIVFDDASELVVTPYILDALPDALHLRLRYER